MVFFCLRRGFGLVAFFCLRRLWFWLLFLVFWPFLEGLLVY